MKFLSTVINIMTLQEIKTAVKAGKTVHWVNEGYIVAVNKYDNWFITFKANQSAIGLTWRDGVTMNGKESEFYIGESFYFKREDE